MKSWKDVIIAAAVLACLFAPAAAEESVGGDQGWYVIHCNVYGAKVYLDDKYVGETNMETLTVPAYTTGTPYQTFKVVKYGYITYTDSIPQIPAKGESVDLYATLNPVPETVQTGVGGDMGWYVVHCNVDGATVYFDSSNRGEISQGTVYVPVYSTGAPYRTMTVKKEGYSPYTQSLTDVPAKGQTIDLYATLNPVVTTVPTPAPTTPASIGGDMGWYRVHCNVDGAMVSFDNEEKGTITDGSLSVPVYVTGTPYRTFTVYKAGFVPYSGAIDTFPKKGETVDLYATLNPRAETPVPTTQSPSYPLAGLLALGILLIGIKRNV